MNKLIIIAAICAIAAIGVVAAVLLSAGDSDKEHSEKEFKDPYLLELKKGDYIEYSGDDHHLGIRISEVLEGGWYKLEAYDGDMTEDARLTMNRIQFLSNMYPHITTNWNLFNLQAVDESKYVGVSPIDFNGRTIECKVYGSSVYTFVGDYGIVYGQGDSPDSPDIVLKTSLLDGSKHGIAKDPFSKELKVGDYIEEGVISVKYDENGFTGCLNKVDFMLASCIFPLNSYGESSGKKAISFNGKIIDCDLYDDGPYGYDYYVGDYGILYRSISDTGTSNLRTNLDFSI